MRIIKAAPTEWEFTCGCGAVIGYTDEDIEHRNDPVVFCCSCTIGTRVPRWPSDRVVARDRLTDAEAILRTKNWDQ